MSPTPKQARQHRRKAVPTDRTKNVTSWRVEASWDHRPDAPVVIRTSDRKRARRKVTELADKGAYVIFQEHEGWDRWRTVREVDGAALLAERDAEQAAREQAEQGARRRRLAAEAARDARALMSPPAIVRPENRQRARHITGAQR